MQCPGQDSRFWKPDSIYEARCPQCGKDVEFFKDDTARKCPGCGHRFVNPELGFGCAAYCQFAEQCLGSLPEDFRDRQQDMLKDKVRMEVRRYLGADGAGIRRTTNAAAYAERIGKDEGGDLGVILMGALLASLAWIEAERRHGGMDREFLQIQGPVMARDILEKLGAKSEIIDEVCDIVGRLHQPGEQESLNFRVVSDAIALAELKPKQSEVTDSADAEKIDLMFLTARGRGLAREQLLASCPHVPLRPGKDRIGEGSQDIKKISAVNSKDRSGQVCMSLRSGFRKDELK